MSHVTNKLNASTAQYFLPHMPAPSRWLAVLNAAREGFALNDEPAKTGSSLENCLQAPQTRLHRSYAFVFCAFLNHPANCYPVRCSLRNWPATVRESILDISRGREHTLNWLFCSAEAALAEFRRASDDLNSRFYGRREVPRFAIVAPVDLAELPAGVRGPGQLSEISRKGCFIEISKPFTVGTRLNIVISREHKNFETNGTVVYALRRKGVGIAFKETAPEQLGILDAWLGASMSLCFFAPA